LSEPVLKLHLFGTRRRRRRGRRREDGMMEEGGSVDVS